jgi:uncharacterized membrane protein
MSSVTESSAVVFAQHVHPILILVIFFFWGCLKDKVYSGNSRMEELKENIHREIANILAEQLPLVQVLSVWRGTAIFSIFCVICEL